MSAIANHPACVYTTLDGARMAAREWVRDRMAAPDELVIAELGILPPGSRTPRYIVVTKTEFVRFAAVCNWEIAVAT